MHDDAVARLRALVRAADGPGLTQELEAHPEYLFAETGERVILVALALLFLDRLSEAAPLVAAARAVDGRALSPQGVGDLALLYFLTGAIEEARARIAEATAADPTDAVLWARAGAFATAAGALAEAEEAYTQALALEPEPRAALLNNIAALKLRQGRLGEAIALYDRALAADPTLEVAARQRLLALAQLGQGEAALEALEAELAAAPEEPARHRRLAEAQALLGQRAAAAATLLSACERLPAAHELKPDALRMLLAARRLHEAGVHAKRWLEEAALDEETAREIALLLDEARIEAGFYAAAEDDLKGRLEDDPDGSARLLYARLLTETDRAAAAVPLLEALVESLPGRLDALLQLAHTLTALGRLEEADRLIRRVEAAAPALLVQRIEASGHQVSEEERAALERLFVNPILPPEQRASVGFCLYRVRAKAGDDRAAFAALREANELIKRQIRYDWRAHRRQVEETIAAFTPELMTRLAGQGHPSRRPIFVVGMPRSGTTLTEQILGAHPQCAPRGELPWIGRLVQLMPKALNCDQPYPQAVATMTPQDLVNAGDYYLEKAGSGVEAALRLVDKMPHNFDYVGLIALIFPNAPIIHVVRAPLDNALSNYEQNFAAAHGLMGFAFDLDWIGEMLVDHERIMAHWYELLPGRIFRLEYERLVGEPETTIRALLDFCGLPWDDAVLHFQDNEVAVRTASIRQVRQGIYTQSRAKWQRFAAELAPVEKILTRGFQPLAESDAPPPLTPALGWWGQTR
ncbi:hypothetical protein GWK36_00980 [Caldichromatium japonicum]|uniref:Tetratricopeptide repeat protein n=1 Tax=Caldichromatium japonicum TaxID=2699430 RepID=A0A6G7VAA9_9GAMM|nr:tetratricopeptide repeat-containing sulfotransferase family protein [Caldichromatium japonicum]QIK36805.1 hypothetical protein GWK36_00980 [Caldichromatium japonicum]